MKIAEPTWQVGSRNTINVLGAMAGAGVLTGGAIAAMNALNDHMERKKREKSLKNTIVVELPSDRLGKAGEAAKKTLKVPRPKRENTLEKEMPLTHNTQRRDLTGQFGEILSKQSAPNAPGTGSQAVNIAATLIGAPLAFAGGYAATMALYNKLKERRLDDESEMYKQRYMKALIEKGAVYKGEDSTKPSWSLFGPALRFFDPVTGTVTEAAKGVGAGIRGGREGLAAGNKGLAFIERFLKEHGVSFPGAAAATGLTIAGGSSLVGAYLLKKYLDARFGDKLQQTQAVPRRKRIVFKVAPPPPVESDNREEQVKESRFLGALAVELVKQSGDQLSMLSEPIKEVLGKEGFSTDTLFKAASGDTSLAKLACLDNAKVQKVLVDTFIAKDPCILALVKAGALKEGFLLDALTQADRIVSQMDQPPAPVENPLQGSAVSAVERLPEKDDVAMPELSNEDFLVVADNPQVAQFLTKNRTAVTKKLKVPRPKRTKEKQDASYQPSPAKIDGDGARVPEGGA